MTTRGTRGHHEVMELTYHDLPGLMTRMTGDEKHTPSATSTLDVLWVLYDRILHVTPSTVDAPDRDRFLLSKGHGPAAYYAAPSSAPRAICRRRGWTISAASPPGWATTPTTT